MKCLECGSTNAIVDLDMIVAFSINENGQITGIHIPEDEMIEAAQEIMDKPELSRGERMELIISDRFERCASCGATIRPKDDCARDDDEKDLFYCLGCHEQWLESLMHVDGPPPEEFTTRR